MLAPQQVFCGNNKCLTNYEDSLGYSCDKYVNTRVGPPSTIISPDLLKGYTTANHGMLGCTWVTLYTKDNSWTGWDPLKYKFNENERTRKVHSEDLVRDIDECCDHPESLNLNEKFNCGTLVQNGIPDAKVCTGINRAYCGYGPESRLKETRCAPYLMDPKINQRLRDVCRKKLSTDTDWSRECACYYDSSVYELLANKIEEEWNGPPGSYSSLPECIYPKCTASPYRDRTASCPDVSFSQCVQTTNIDIINSSTRDLVLESKCMIDGGWSKKNNSGTGASGPSGASGASGAAAAAATKKADDDKKAAEEAASSKMIWIWIIVIVFALLGVGAAIYMSSSSADSDDDEDPDKGDDNDEEE